MAGKDRHRLSQATGRAQMRGGGGRRLETLLRSANLSSRDVIRQVKRHECNSD